MNKPATSVTVREVTHPDGTTTVTTETVNNETGEKTVEIVEFENVNLTPSATNLGMAEQAPVSTIYKTSNDVEYGDAKSRPQVASATEESGAPVPTMTKRKRILLGTIICLMVVVGLSLGVAFGVKKGGGDDDDDVCCAPGWDKVSDYQAAPYASRSKVKTGQTSGSGCVAVCENDTDGFTAAAFDTSKNECTCFGDVQCLARVGDEINVDLVPDLQNLELYTKGTVSECSFELCEAPLDGFWYCKTGHTYAAKDGVLAGQEPVEHHAQTSSLRQCLEICKDNPGALYNQGLNHCMCWTDVQCFARHDPDQFTAFDDPLFASSVVYTNTAVPDCASSISSCDVLPDEYCQGWWKFTLRDGMPSPFVYDEVHEDVLSADACMELCTDFSLAFYSSTDKECRCLEDVKCIALHSNAVHFLSEPWLEEEEFYTRKSLGRCAHDSCAVFPSICFTLADWTPYPGSQFLPSGADPVSNHQQVTEEECLLDYCGQYPSATYNPLTGDCTCLQSVACVAPHDSARFLPGDGSYFAVGALYSKEAVSTCSYDSCTFVAQDHCSDLGWTDMIAEGLYPAGWEVSTSTTREYSRTDWCLDIACSNWNGAAYDSSTGQCTCFDSMVCTASVEDMFAPELAFTTFNLRFYWKGEDINNSVPPCSYSVCEGPLDNLPECLAANHYELTDGMPVFTTSTDVAFVDEDMNLWDCLQDCFSNGSNSMAYYSSLYSLCECHVHQNGDGCFAVHHPFTFRGGRDPLLSYAGWAFFPTPNFPTCASEMTSCTLNPEEWWCVPPE